MKIVQICSASDIGGGERHVADLANALAREGHEVFAGLRPNAAIEKALSDTPRSNIEFFRMRNAADISSARKIGTFVRQNDIELIHAHLARDYPIAAAASKVSGTPFVITRHVLFPMKRIQKLLLRNVAGVIAPSAAIARSLIADGVIEPSKITTILHGIDVGQFNQTRKIEDEVKVIGTVGHISKVKGQDVFVHAAKLVLGSRPDIQFVIVGEDKSKNRENRRSITELIDKLGVRKHVIIEGWSDDVRVPLARMDIAVSAARVEPFGLSMVEAMAAGVPLVATRTDGSVEIVKDGETGILVANADAEALANGILQLINSQSLRTTLASNAKEAAKRDFSLERMVRETVSFYDSAIRRQRTA